MQKRNKINMFNRISDLFYDKSNLKVAIAGTAIFVAYLFLVMTRQAISFDTVQGDIKSLGMTFGFDEAAVIRFFQARTETMIAAYIQFTMIWDNIFAAIYGLMYAAWLSVLLKASKTKFGILNLVPFLQVIFDFLENTSLVYIANIYLTKGDIQSYFVSMASIFVMAKWVCSALTYLALLLGLWLLSVKLFKLKKK